MTQQRRARNGGCFRCQLCTVSVPPRELRHVTLPPFNPSLDLGLGVGREANVELLLTLFQRFLPRDCHVPRHCSTLHVPRTLAHLSKHPQCLGLCLDLAMDAKRRRRGGCHYLLSVSLDGRP